MVWTQMIYSINDIRVITVNQAHMTAVWNKHATFYLDGSIADTDAEKLERLIYCEDMIDILFQEQEGGQSILFSGYLKNLNMGKLKSGCHFELSITGFTYSMDVVEKIRVFQNKDMTYGQIATEVLKSYGCGILSSADLDKSIGQILVQYHETDWEFLKRLASHFHMGIVGNYRNKSKYVSIGLCDSEEICLNPAVYTVKCNNQLCEFKKRNGVTEIIDEDSISYECTNTKHYNVGDSVLFHNKKLYINKVEMQFIGEELVFSYKMQRKNAFAQIKRYNNHIIGMSLDGKIVNVKNDMVKVCMDKGDNGSEEKLSWLPYSTVYSSPDGTGWYCMPEIGDCVRVYFPNEMEEGCYACSSVHVAGGDSEQIRNNPDNKSITTKYGKQIELTPCDIKISNGNGMLICISDTDGIILVSKEDIVLKAGGNISLVSANDSVNLCAAEAIVLKQGNNTITVKDEIRFEGTKVKVQ